MSEQDIPEGWVVLYAALNPKAQRVRVILIRESDRNKAPDYGRMFDETYVPHGEGSTYSDALEAAIVKASKLPLEKS